MVACVAAHYDDDDDDDVDGNDVDDRTADSPRERKRTKKVLKCPNADRSRFRNKTKNAPKTEKSQSVIIIGISFSEMVSKQQNKVFWFSFLVL